MRVEPAPHVFRNEDRRSRFTDRRARAERRVDPVEQPRARHAAHLWFTPAFGAQILGQIAPETVVPARAERAYQQPEALTPLRPSLVKTA
ncbi:MAG TPA: hypothetical protein VG942_00605 [Hyphomonadaceae bacterium]|nr:hypothetical protein [Hyphomonadaceae bacterium]